MSKIRYGVPIWLDQFPQKRRPTYPRHRGNLETEVAIIGGGITGCATAYAFASAGFQVTLFETGRIGQGITAASTAMLTQEPEIDFQDLSKRDGLRSARRIWQMTRRATFDLTATLRRLNVQCQLRPQDSIYFSVSDESAKRLRHEYEARRNAGLKASWLNANRLRRETNLLGCGAIRTDGNARVDPYRVCLGFSSAAIKHGARIHECSEVIRLRSDRKAVEIKTQGGITRADCVVIATGCVVPLFKSLARHFRLMQTYAVVTPPLNARVRAELGSRDTMLWDTESPYHYLRWTRDGRIVFGGADQQQTSARRRQKILVQRTGQLMYELSKLYPVISGIQPEYGWDSAIVTTVDQLPYIGPHRKFPRHLFALGQGGNGFMAGFLASRVLLRHYLGKPAKGDELFSFSRGS